MPAPWTTSLCEICRRGASSRLCAGCLGEHAGPAWRCGHCALRLDGPGAACAGCAGDPPPMWRTVCAVDYASPWDRLVADFKFHAQPELASLMVDLMTRQASDAASRDIDLVLPVPLGPTRLAERGYDQAWELARRLGRRLRRPARSGWLSRRTETSRQSTLGRAQRQANLDGAFEVPEPRTASLRGQRVALVDDVMTTGATARQATQALLAAGAASVELWVFARTPAC